MSFRVQRGASGSMVFIALGMSLSMWGCTSRSVETILADEGFEEIEVRRAGLGQFHFEAVRGDQRCKGTIELNGMPGVSSKKSIEEECSGPAAADATPEVRDPLDTRVDAVEGIVGLGGPVEITSARLPGVDFDIKWVPDDELGQTAGALLLALMMGDREWISARATSEFQAKLAKQQPNLSSLLSRTRAFELGEGRLMPGSDEREIVTFPLSSSALVRGANLELSVAYRDGMYDGFQLGGTTWAPLAEEFRQSERSFGYRGSWVEANGVVAPGGSVAVGSEGVVVQFVYDGYRVLDGYGLVTWEYTVERDGKTVAKHDTENIRVEGVDTPRGWFQGHVAIEDLQPGRYRVEAHAADVRHGHHGMSWTHQFDVVDPR